MTTKIKPINFAVISAALFGLMMAPITFSNQAYADGTLFIGADVEEFNGFPDKIGKYDTVGGVAVGANIFLGENDTANGMTVIGPNQLLTGTPGLPFAPDAATAQTVKIRDFATIPGLTAVADIPAQTFNEDYAYDGTSVWHSWFNGSNGKVIELDPNNLGGPALSVHNLDFGPIGAAIIDGDLWISDWIGQTYGIFDPSDDSYTPMFSTMNGTNAGCLAFDAHSRIIWAGEQGGLIVPYDADSLTPINNGFQPFGAINDTIDGCAFWSPIGGEKTWTHTDYNWDERCDGFINGTICQESDTNSTDIGFRPANINDDSDVLADPLPLTSVGNATKYTAFAQVHNNDKFQNTNPGAFYALTTVTLAHNVDGVKVTEEYSNCTDGGDGILQFVSKKETRNVKVAIAAPNGDVTELTDDLYDGIGGSISANIDEAEILIDQTLPAGTTVYALVKFQDNLKGFDTGDGEIDVMCDNTETVESIFNGADNESTVFDASLRITNVP